LTGPKIAANRGGPNEKLLELGLAGIDADFIMRPENMQVGLNVKDLYAEDCITEKNAFPKMISVVSDSGDVSEDLSFLHVDFQLNPLDKHADMVAAVVMNSINVVVTKPVIDRLLKFFESRQKVEVATLQETASSSIWSTVAASRGQLEFAAQQHKTMDVSVDVHAPCVLVPLDASNLNSSLVVLDLGNISLRSELRPKKKEGEEEEKKVIDEKATEEKIAKAEAEAAAQEKQGQPKELIKKEDTIMYDKYKLDISNIKVVMTNMYADGIGKRFWREERKPEMPESVRVVDDLSFGIALYMCIQPNELTLASLVVDGEIPDVSVCVPLSLYDKVMEFVKAFVPPSPASNDVVVSTPADEKPAETVAYDRILGSSEEQNNGALEVPMETEQDKEKEKEEDAKNGLTPEQKQRLLKHHKKIEASFVIRKITLLLRATPDHEEEQDLLRFSIEEVGAYAAVRTWSTNVSARIGALNVEDCIAVKAGCKVPYLITSKRVSASEELSRGEEKDLLSVEMTQSQRDTPTYKNVDLDVAAHFAQLFVVVNQEYLSTTVRVVLDFLKKLQLESKKEDEKKLLEAASKDEAKEEKVETEKAESKEEPKEEKKEEPTEEKKEEEPKEEKKEEEKKDKKEKREKSHHDKKNKKEDKKDEKDEKKEDSKKKSSHHDKKDKKEAPKKKDEGPKTFLGEKKFKIPEVVKIRARAEVDCIGLIFVENDKNMAEIRVESVRAEARIKERTLCAFACLKNIAIDDCITDPEKKHSMLCIDDTSKDLLDAKYETFSYLEEQFPGYDAQVHAELRALRVVPIMSFVMHLKDYFLEGPLLKAVQSSEQATKAITDTYAGVADSVGSTMNSIVDDQLNTEVKKSEEKPPERISRMSLNVSLAAPTIRVPLKYEDEEFITLTLGTLKLTNEADEKKGVPLDKMKITLSGLSLQTTMEKTTLPLLKSLDLDLSFVRALVSGNSVVPEQQLSLVCHPFQFVITEKQLKFVLSFFQEFMKTLPSAPAEQPAPSDSPKEIEDSKTKEDTPAPTEEEPKKEVAPRTVEEVSSFFGMKFDRVAKTVVDAVIEEISITLLTGDGLDEKAQALASFGIYDIKAKVYLRPEDFLDCKVSLGAITLDDTRENSPSKFLHVIRSPSYSGKDRVPLISVKYMQHMTTGDKAADVQLEKLQVFVAPSIVCTVKDFFMVPLAKMNADLAKQKKEEEKKKLEEKEMTEEKKEDAEKKETTDKKEEKKEEAEEKKEIAEEKKEDGEKKEDAEENKKESEGGEEKKHKHHHHHHHSKSSSKAPAESAAEPSAEPAATAAAETAEKKEEKTEAEDKEGKLKKKMVSFADEKVAQPTKPSREAALCATVHIVSPEISVLGDETKEDTLSVFVTGSFDVKYSHGCDGRDSAEIQVNALRMSIQPPTESKHAKVFHIISPFDVSLVYSAWNEKIEEVTDEAQRKALTDKGMATVGKQKVVILLKPIKLCFSYQTLNLALNIFESLKSLGETPATDEESKESTEKEKEEEKSTPAAVENKPETPAEPAPVAPFVPVLQGLSVSSEGIKITVLNDFQGRNVPLLQLKLKDLTADAEDWSSCLRASASATLAADFFNENIMMKEPLIEDWSFGVIFNSFDEHKALVKPEPGALKPPKTDITLCAKKTLNINLSATMVDNIARTYSSLSADFYSLHGDKYFSVPKPVENTKDQEEEVKPESPAAAAVAAAESAAAPAEGEKKKHKHKHKHSKKDDTPTPSTSLAVPSGNEDSSDRSTSGVRNMTGIDATMIVRFMEKVEGIKKTEEELKLANGVLVPVTLGNADEDVAYSRNQVRVGKLKLSEEEFDNVPLDRIGCTLLPSSSKLEPLVAEVTWDKTGKKVTILRSSVVMNNTTEMPLLVRFVNDHNEKAEITVPAEGSCPVPLGFSLKSTFTVQPTGKAKMSEEKIPLALTKKGDLVTIHCPGEDKNSSVYLTTKISADTTTFAKEKFSQLNVSFHTPFKFQNTLPATCKFSFGSLVNGKEKGMVMSEPVELAPGKELLLYNYDPRADIKMALSGLPNKIADTSKVFSAKVNETKVEKIKIADAKGEKDELSVEFSMNPTRTFIVFAPYWLVNKACTPLVYVSSRRHKPICGMEDMHKSIAGPNHEEECLPMMCTHDSICIKTPEGPLSSSFSIETVGTSGLVECIDPKSKTLYSLQASCYLGQGVFNRTKIVTFCPHHVMVNQMKDRTVVLHQCDLETTFELKPGEEHPYFLTVPDKCTDPMKIKRRVYITLKNSDGSDVPCERSGFFFLEEAGQNVLRLRGKEGKPDVFQPYEATESYYTLYTMWRDSSDDFIPFKIENDTSYEFKAVQKECEKITKIGAKETVAFGWDEPLFEPIMMVSSSILGDSSRKFNINKIAVFKPIKIKKSPTVYSYTKAVGGTRVLVLTEDKEKLIKESKQPEGVLEKQSSRQLKSSKKLKEEEEKKKKEEERKLSLEMETRVMLDLPGLEVSILDNKPLEFLLLSLHGMSMNFIQTPDDIQLEVKLMRLQLDNQYEDVEFPTVISGRPLNETTPWFHMSLVKSTRFDSLDFFQYFSLLVQDIKVQVETDFIGQILEFVNTLPLATFTAIKATDDFITLKESSLSLTKRKELAKKKDEKKQEKDKKKEAAPERRSEWESEGEHIIDTKGVQKRMMYFRLFHLNPMKIIFTLSSRTGSSLGLPRNAVTVLVDTLLGTVANLDNASLCFNSLYLENPFVSQDYLTQLVSSHYTRQGIQQIYKLLGSTEALGNPVGLFSNVGTGVMDFFYEPAQGIIQSPQAFAKGLAKGTSSLVKNTVYGTFNSVSKIAGAIGKGVATLSFDDEYVKKRQINQRKEPKHFISGAGQGAFALGKGIFDGITGIVVKPVQGARKDGAKGFAKGIGQGVVGVVVKPVAGVFEAVSKTSEGIKNTAVYFDKDRILRRIRPFPRLFTPEKCLLPYDEYECEGAFLLRHDPTSAGERHVLHMHSGKKSVIAVSTKHVVRMKADNMKVEFVIPLAAIDKVEEVRGGIVATVKKEVKCKKDRLEFEEKDPDIAAANYKKLTEAIAALTPEEVQQMLAPPGKRGKK